MHVLYLYGIYGGIRDYKLVAFICRFVKVGHYEAEMSKTENFPRLGIFQDLKI